MGIILVVQVGERWRFDYKTYVTVSPGLVLELGPHLWLAVDVLLRLSVRTPLLFHRFHGRLLLCLTCGPALVLEDHKRRVCTIEVRRIEQRTVRKRDIQVEMSLQIPRIVRNMIAGVELELQS